MDYHLMHARRAADFLRVRDRRVLVIGCNTGEDCRPFVEWGALVDGLDVIPNIGSGFRHGRVHYVQASAESIPVPAERYDLVYAVATMEHVPDIARAFREMARVTARNGYIYCVSSPLWNSRFGHHKIDLFGDFPWAHLRYSAGELLAQCERAGLREVAGLPIKAHIDYIYDTRFFNRRAARDYIRSSANLGGMRIIENALGFDEPSVIPDSVYQELQAKGYPTEELLAVTHTYIARKGSLSLLLAKSFVRKAARRTLNLIHFCVVGSRKRR